MYLQDHGESCGILIIAGFSDEIPTTVREFVEDLELTYLEDMAPILEFSVNHKQQVNLRAFLSFLKRENQTIVSSPWITNPGSGNRIKAFLWTPTREFKRKLKAEINKIRKENDAKEQAEW